jgi:uncharacterized protein (TIGR00255 family)
MTKSMTGFANAKGAFASYSWVWEIRSVNSRGMDARLRVPDWIIGLEAALRPIIQKTVARGNVNLTLKVTRGQTGQGALIEPAALNNILVAIKQIEDSAINDHDIQLASTNAADILGMRAMGDANQDDDDTAALLTSLTENFSGLLEAFDTMRKNEGAALQKILTGHIAQIETLTKRADTVAKSRQGAMAQSLRENLARVLDNSDGTDPDRVAQELALLSMKADVSEEIDRLHAHVSAARDLLNETGPVGRKLDFLSQEFNREANTLCSKSHAIDLTKIGLDLKAVIEQFREQIQNME